MDLYPNVAVAAGVVRAHGLVHRALGAVMGRALRRADRIVVLGGAMRRPVLAAGVSRRRLRVIENWAPAAVEAAPLPPAPAEGPLVLMYSGNYGVPHDLGPFLAALAEVPADLAGVEGTRIVLLVTDGAESCGGDPGAAIAALAEGGVEVTLNIVGFALDDEELKAQMAGWAEAGGGSYYDATSAAELASAIGTALGAPFRVYPADPATATDGDEPAASGTVGGEAVTLDPGTYRVEVLADPPVTFEEVVVPGGENVSLELPSAGEE